MCRLLCYMGEPIPMEVLITKPEHSLVFQSRDASFHPGCADKRNIRVNGDGFGVAWYNPKKIDEGGCLVKCATPAWCSSNLLNIAKFVESGLVFAHVRAASDGAALTGNVNHENTHPFKLKRYTFMHNGGIPGFNKMKRELLSNLGDEAYEAIEGTTDSEVCFAYFLDELPNTDAQLTADEIAQALRGAIARLVSGVVRFNSVCARTRSWAAAAHTATVCGETTALSEPDVELAVAPPPGQDQENLSAAPALPSAPAMSLNFCVTDGRHIVCSRYRNHPRQDPPSLFYLSGMGFACDEVGSCLRLTGSEPRTSVLISSEPLCRSTKSWELVPRNSVVIVEGGAPTTATAPGNTSAGGNTPAATVVRQGLVSSIKIEPLRCHPSDAPDPADPAFTASSSSCSSTLHNHCTRVRSDSAGTPRNAQTPSPVRGRIPRSLSPHRLHSPVPKALREESVNVGGSGAAEGGNGNISGGIDGGVVGSLEGTGGGVMPCSAMDGGTVASTVRA